MQLTKTWRVVRLAVILGLLLVAAPYAVTAQNPVVSTTVSGQLNEQFAKHYLSLQVIDPGQPVTITMDYQPQHSNDLDGDSGFYVFTTSGFNQYVAAVPPSESAFRTGILETTDGTKRKESVIGTDNTSNIANLVTYNDTTTPFSYTLTGENVRFVDQSGEQVAGDSMSAPTATPAPATAAPAPEAAATPSASGGAVRASTVSGELDEQFAKHYLGLEVIDPGQPVTIKMDYQPQHSSDVDANSGFYVFTTSGFNQYVAAVPPSESAFRTGILETTDGTKRKESEIGTDNTSNIAALVTYNDTATPFSYTLTGENVRFVDESGEQVMGDRMSTPTEQPTSETAAPTAAPAGESIAPGSSYTVQSGDSLGTISSRAYGSNGYWSAICTANSLANCDLIEVGDVLTIPTQAEADAFLAGGRVLAPTAEPTSEMMPEPTATVTPEPTTGEMPEPTAEGPPGAGNLIDVAGNHDQLDILLLALDLAGLSASIADGGPFTIFAPTNAAFASLPEARLDMLMADTVLLAETLNFHVVAGRLTSTDLATATSLETLHGGTIEIGTSEDGSLTVDEVTIGQSDVTASNGVIHFIHQMLLPPEPEN